MDDYRRNGHPAEAINKKDKRRQQIATRLSKLEATFADDKNSFYRSLLHNLQSTLAGIQQGTNEDYVKRKIELEEMRDFQLTSLRLWEEYQVKRVEDEYKEEMATAKENYDHMIKLLKEKFYDKLQTQVKQLKEDKLLLNLVNSSSWNTNGSSYTSVSALAAASEASLSLADRRSLRKRDLNSRFTSGEADDLSDSGLGSPATNGGGRVGMGSGFGSAAKRRRHYTTRYSSNDELSSGITSSAGHHDSGSVHNGHASGNDSNLSDKDYDELNNMIMNNDDGGVSKIFTEKEKSTGRPHTRGSNKQSQGVQGLTTEELNEDLNLLRNAVKREMR